MHHSCLLDTRTHYNSSYIQKLLMGSYFNSMTACGYCLQDHFLSPGRQGLRARRIDWLLHILIGPLTLHYLHTDYVYRKYNRVEEQRIKSSVAQALLMPDTCVRLPEKSGEAVLVASSSTDTTYKVLRAGTAEPACTCATFLRGTTCKHIVKVPSELTLPSDPIEHMSCMLQ